MNNKITRWLDLQKEGIFLGGAIALAIYYFNITIPYLNITETGLNRLIILLAIFTIGGALVDSWYKPSK